MCTSCCPGIVGNLTDCILKDRANKLGSDFDLNPKMSSKKKLSGLDDEDDIPDLVSSEDEDDIDLGYVHPMFEMYHDRRPGMPGHRRRKNLHMFPCLPRFMKNNEVAELFKKKFIEDSQIAPKTAQNMRIVCLDPFLFETDNEINYNNDDWIKAAFKFGFSFGDFEYRLNSAHMQKFKLIEVLELAIDRVKEYLETGKIEMWRMYKLSDDINTEYKKDIYEVSNSEDALLEDVCDKIIQTAPKWMPVIDMALLKFSVLYVMRNWTYYSRQYVLYERDPVSVIDVECTPSAENNRRLGSEKIREEDYSSAHRYLLKAIRECPYSYVCYADRARCLLALHQPAAAACDGKRAVVLKPDWIEGYYHYAEALYQSRYIKEALHVNSDAFELLDRGTTIYSTKDKDNIISQEQKIKKRIIDVELMKNPRISVKYIEDKYDWRGLLNVDEFLPCGQTGRICKGMTDNRCKKEMPDLASAESSDEEDVPVLDKASETKFREELRVSSKPLVEARHMEQVCRELKQNNTCALRVKVKLKPDPNDINPSVPTLPPGIISGQPGAWNDDDLANRMQVTIDSVGKVDDEIRRQLGIDSPVKKKPTRAQKRETQAPNKETLAKKKEPPVQKKEPPVQKKEPPVQKKEPPVQKKEPPVQKKEAPGPNQQLQALKPATQGVQKEMLNGHEKCPSDTPRLSKAKIKADARQRFTKMMKEGSEAFLDSRYRQSAESYHEALEFLNREGSQYLGIKKLDVMVLRYARAMALIESGKTEHIVEALTDLKQLTGSPLQSFPLAYLGICRGYMKLNRFKEAMEPIRLAKMVLDASKTPLSFQTWPATKTIIDETRHGKLAEVLSELDVTCHSPPRPDAICSFEDCHGYSKKEIYFNDPDFQGFVRTSCYAGCRVDFHPNCWRKYRNESEFKHTEKDYMEKPCLTPDCYATITKLIIFDKDGHKKKEFVAEAPKKKSRSTKKEIKQAPVNPEKIRRRQERRERRRQRRREAKAGEDEADAKEDILKDLERKANEASTEESASMTTEDQEIRSCTTGGCVTGEDDPFPMKEENMTVLKKDDDKNDLYMSTAGKTSTKHKKKKKEKTKVTLSLDEFVGRDSTDPAMYDEDGQTDAPFGIPSRLRHDIEAFGSNRHLMSGAGDAEILLTPEERNIADNLLSFFEDHCRANGPFFVNDIVVNQFMEDFPPEAREVINRYESLARFLLSSLKFAMIEDHICLLKDTLRARQMADKHKGLPSPTDFPTTLLLNPMAGEFKPSSITNHGVLSNSDTASLPNLPQYGDNEGADYRGDFPVLQDSAARCRADSVLSDRSVDYDLSALPLRSSSSSLENVTGQSYSGELSEESTSNEVETDNVNKRAGPTCLDPPRFLSGPPLAQKNNIGVFRPNPLSKKSLASVNVRSSSVPEMEGQRGQGDDRNESRTTRKSTADEFSQQVPDEMYKAESESINGLDDLDGVDDVVVTATDAEKLDGEDYIENPNDDSENSLLCKTVGKERSAGLKSSLRDAPNDRTVGMPLQTSPPLFSWNAVPGEKEITMETRPVDLHSDNRDEVLREKMKRAEEAWNSPARSLPDGNLSEGSINLGTSLPSITASNSFPSQSGGLEYSKMGPPGFSTIEGAMHYGQNTERNEYCDMRQNSSFGFDPKVSSEFEIQRIDDEFMQELCSSVVRDLRSHPIFADDESLAELIRDTIVKDFRRSALPMFTDNITHDESSRKNPQPASALRSMGTQSCVERENKGIQTDSYEPFKLERDALQKQLADTMKRLTNAQSTMAAQGKRFTELQTKYEEVKKMHNESSSNNLSDRKKCKEENVMLRNEVLLLKKQLAAEKTREASSSHELQEKISELTSQLADASEQATAERFHHSRIIKQLEADTCQLSDFARTAEKKLLEFKLETSKQVLGRSLKEADAYQNDLIAACKKYEECRLQIPPLLQNGVEQWNIARETIQRMISQSENEFQNQIQKVNEGQPLASLPEIALPCPPPPPETLPFHMLSPPTLQSGNTSSGAYSSRDNSPHSIHSGTPSPPLGQVSQDPRLHQIPSGKKATSTALPRQPPAALAHPRSPSPSAWNQPPVHSYPPPAVGQVNSHHSIQNVQVSDKNSPSRGPPVLSNGAPKTRFSGPLPASAQVTKLKENQQKKQPGSNVSKPQVSTSGQPRVGSPVMRPPGIASPVMRPPGIGPPGLRPPTAPGNLDASKKTNAPKNSFEKIIVNLGKMFPNYKRQQLTGYVQRLRSSRKGSLSGLTLDDIVSSVANMIFEEDPHSVSSLPTGASSISGLSPISPPHNGQSGVQIPFDQYTDDGEDLCVICHEEMPPRSYISLDCGHIFHDKCIRTWLREQSTCPTCRKYALLVDEFPKLG